MKNWFKILIPLVIIDFLIIRYCFLYNDPDPSSAIVIIILVPGALITNLIIAAVFYFFKRIQFSKIFFANSLIASIMMYILFNIGSQRYLDKRYESWSFKLSKNTYRITRQKMNNQFYILESTNPGSSWSYMDGTYKKSSNDWVLNADTLIMKITENNYLIGFPNSIDSIKMTKIR